MKVKYINGNYYIYSNKLNVYLRMRQSNGLAVTIEIADSLPIDGDEYDCGDITVLALFDNLNQLALQLSNEALNK